MSESKMPWRGKRRSKASLDQGERKASTDKNQTSLQKVKS